MYKRLAQLWSVSALLLLSVTLVTSARAEQADLKAIDLEAFRLIALQNDGRFKTLDTLARETVRHITGSTFFEKEQAGAKVKQDPVFTYLDMIFNAKAYEDIRVIHIKKKPIREALTAAAVGEIKSPELNAILKDGDRKSVV